MSERDYIEYDQLFLDEWGAISVSEYSLLMDLIRDYLDEAYTQIDIYRGGSPETFNSVCGMFVKAIVAYARMAHDNLRLGHIKAANMLNRAIIENYVSLALLHKYEAKGLWKYWIVHSFYNTPRKYGSGFPPEAEEGFSELCSRLEIDPEYVATWFGRDYSWVYPLRGKERCSFRTLCKLAEEDCYKDYQMMSEFSHGASLFQKATSFSHSSSIGNTLSLLFYYVVFTIDRYAPQSRTPEMDLLEGEIWAQFEQEFEPGAEDEAE